MTATGTPTEVRRPTAASAWALSVAGIMLAAAGVIWWIWDWNPILGRLLVSVGIVFVITGVMFARRHVVPAPRVVTAIAVLGIVLGSVEIVVAIRTIFENNVASLV